MTRPSDKVPLDPYKDILGIQVTPERLEEILQTYEAILEAIGKLRTLDLTDVQPAVVFDPTAGYPNEPES
jgi:hypothetical protein